MILTCLRTGYKYQIVQDNGDHYILKSKRFKTPFLFRKDRPHTVEGM